MSWSASIFANPASADVLKVSNQCYMQSQLLNVLLFLLLFGLFVLSLFFFNNLLNKLHCLALRGRCLMSVITVVINNLLFNHFIIRFYFIVYL